MPELDPITSPILRQQLTDDVEDFLNWGGTGAPSFKPHVLHRRKWETYPLAMSGTRKDQEEDRFAQAAMSLRLFAAAAVVVPGDRSAFSTPVCCRFAATSPAIAALRIQMLELSAFFRPLDELDSPALADGYAGLIQPTGRIVIAGPAEFLAQFRNRLFEIERERLAEEKAASESDLDINTGFGSGGGMIIF